MHLTNSLVLFGAALIAGTLNSVAGGGSFISFPALIFTGVPPIQANATNTAALWPGTVASTSAYRRSLSGEFRRYLIPVVVTGIVGGVLGALILLRTPQNTFLRLIPWMLLGATILFATSGKVVSWFRRRTASWKHAHRVSLILPLVLQLLIAVYIGFFGAGAGILTLAMLALMGIENIHTMNGFKSLLVSLCNAVALVVFVSAGVILWPQALLMLAGSIIGGYGGAYYAQKLPPKVIRQTVIAVGLIMSAIFFIRLPRA